MMYLFKAKTTKTIRIEANNMEQAKKEYLDNHVYINKKRVKKQDMLKENAKIDT